MFVEQVWSLVFSALYTSTSPTPSISEVTPELTSLVKMVLEVTACVCVWGGEIYSRVGGDLSTQVCEWSTYVNVISLIFSSGISTTVA